MSALSPLTETLTTELDPGLLEAGVRRTRGFVRILQMEHVGAIPMSASSAYRPRSASTEDVAPHWLPRGTVDYSLVKFALLMADDLSHVTNTTAVHAYRPHWERLVDQQVVHAVWDTREDTLAVDLLSDEAVERQLARYESEFGMSSEEFLRRAREGAVPDTLETMDWMMLLRLREATAQQ